MATENENADNKRRKKRSSRSKRAKKDVSAQDIVTWFAACGRCSFFLAGYRLLDEVDSLETAVTGSESGWLSLTWNQEMCHLLNKSYGCRVDIECFYLDGTCPECHRHFVFRAADEDNDIPDFRIESVPRSNRR